MSSYALWQHSFAESEEEMHFMDDVKKAIIAGLDILSQQDLRMIFIVVNTFCQAHGKGIAVSNGKVIITK